MYVRTFCASHILFFFFLLASEPPMGSVSDDWVVGRDFGNAKRFRLPSQ